MPLAQSKVYTEADYYNLPEDVRAELIEGNLIYNQAPPPESIRLYSWNYPERSGIISDRKAVPAGFSRALRCQAERGQEYHS